MAGPFEGYPKGGVAGLDPAAGDDRAPAVSATVYGWWPGESAWRARSLPRQHGVSYPWHQSTADHRHGSFLRLLSPGKSRRYRSVRQNSTRHQGSRPTTAGVVISLRG